MKRTRFIPIEKVRPGQQFRHYGNLYRRAEDAEVERHPARSRAEELGRSTVLAYGMDRGRKTPMSFVVTDDRGAEIRVVVASDGGVV